ncbi:MAG: TIGR03618 family F420-dependent PPOX class oxidoreductase, partial [Nocardioidaceae bacterium]
MPDLPDTVLKILDKPNPAVIATVRADGQPVSVATWYLIENDQVLVNMDEGRRRLDYLRNDPRVSLTVMDSEDWHTHVSLQGRVVELADDGDLVDIDRLSRRYLGRPYQNRTRRRVSAWIAIDRWHGWGAAARSRV